MKSLTLAVLFTAAVIGSAPAQAGGNTAQACDESHCREVRFPFGNGFIELASTSNTGSYKEVVLWSLKGSSLGQSNNPEVRGLCRIDFPDRQVSVSCATSVAGKKPGAPTIKSFATGQEAAAFARTYLGGASAKHTSL